MSVPSVRAADPEVDRAYRRYRRNVFAGIFLRYAAYYLVRNNLALAIPDILREFPQHSKAELGLALTGLSLSYGLSKFLMGAVSDRSNAKYLSIEDWRPSPLADPSINDLQSAEGLGHRVLRGAHSRIK